MLIRAYVSSFMFLYHLANPEKENIFSNRKTAKLFCDYVFFSRLYSSEFSFNYVEETQVKRNEKIIKYRINYTLFKINEYIILQTFFKGIDILTAYKSESD